MHNKYIYMGFVDSLWALFSIGFLLTSLCLVPIQSIEVMWDSHCNVVFKFFVNYCHSSLESRKHLNTIYTRNAITIFMNTVCRRWFMNNLMAFVTYFEIRFIFYKSIFKCSWFRQIRTFEQSLKMLTENACIACPNAYIAQLRDKLQTNLKFSVCFHIGNFLIYDSTHLSLF